MANKMAIKPYDDDMAATIGRLKNKESDKETNKYVPTEAFTCRISADTVIALRKAAVDRKIARKFPASQVEIVQTALDNWLKENGYL